MVRRQTLSTTLRILHLGPFKNGDFFLRHLNFESAFLEVFEKVQEIHSNLGTTSTNIIWSTVREWAREDICNTPKMNLVSEEMVEDFKNLMLISDRPTLIGEDQFSGTTEKSLFF